MKTNITIPETTKEQEIIEFRVQPSHKMITVVLSADGRPSKVPVSIDTLWTNATDTQKTIIKEFFKLIGLEALNQFNADNMVDIKSADIEGDLFDTAIAETKEI